MVSTKQAILAAAIAVLVGVCLVAVLVPPTDDYSPYNSGWNGLSKAVKALDAKLVNLDSLEAHRPDRLAVLVVGVEKPATPQQCEILKKLVVYGATVVVMDETGKANQLLECLGVGARVGRGVLVDPLHYVLDPRLPIARLELAGKRMAKLYLNIASPIEVVGGRGSCIGYTYKTAFVDLDGDGKRDPVEPSGRMCVCYRESLGNGTVYLFSDSSILLNAMIDKMDNLNALKTVVENKTVVLIADFWEPSLHTKLVMALEHIGRLATNTSLRYLIAFLLAVTVYLVAANAGKTRR